VVGRTGGVRRIIREFPSYCVSGFEDKVQHGEASPVALRTPRCGLPGDLGECLSNRESGCHGHRHLCAATAVTVGNGEKAKFWSSQWV
jgi:hypothetical protein